MKEVIQAKKTVSSNALLVEAIKSGPKMNDISSDGRLYYFIQKINNSSAQKGSQKSMKRKNDMLKQKLEANP